MHDRLDEADVAYYRAQEQEADHLASENLRLREALQAIAGAQPSEHNVETEPIASEYGCYVSCSACEDLIETARRAIAPTGS